MNPDNLMLMGVFSLWYASISYVSWRLCWTVIRNNQNLQARIMSNLAKNKTQKSRVLPILEVTACFVAATWPLSISLYAFDLLLERDDTV